MAKFNSLKIKILEVYGDKLSCIKDCEVLAVMISERTERAISTSTIRRVFGFLKLNNMPRKYTLNTLSMYAGFLDWDDFCEKYDKENTTKVFTEDDWRKFYKKTLFYSKSTSKLLLEIAGIPKEGLINRGSAEMRIEEFMQSSAQVMPLIADGGAGKSIMLAKWVEHKWVNNSCDDAIIFVNASLLMGFLGSEFKLSYWLQKQIGLGEEGLFIRLLHDVNLCRGKIVIVLDGVDKVIFDEARVERLFLQINQFILDVNHSDKIKFILSFRSASWERFVGPIMRNNKAIMQGFFYAENYNSEYRGVYLQQLKGNEVQTILDKTINNRRKERIEFNNMSFRLREIIVKPIRLEAFIGVGNKYTFRSEITGYSLVQEFLNSQVYTSSYSEEKDDLLTAYIKLTDYGRAGFLVKKYELRKVYPIHLKTAGNYYAAYQEFLSYGIFIERITINEYGNYSKYVFISNEFLSEFLIGKELIEKNKGFSVELLKKIEKDYVSRRLRRRLLAVVISISLRGEKSFDVNNLLELTPKTLFDSMVLEVMFSSKSISEKVKTELLETISNNKEVACLLSESISENFYLNNINKDILDLLVNKPLFRCLKVKVISMLLFSELLMVSIPKATVYYNMLIKEPINAELDCFSLGVRYGAVLFYNSVVKEEPFKINELLRYAKLVNVSKKYSGKEQDIDFEVIVLMLVAFIGDLNEVLAILDAECGDLKREDTSSYKCKLLKCYKIYAAYQDNRDVDNKIDYLEACNSDLELHENYIFLIYNNVFLSRYYLAKNDRYRARESFFRAIDISDSVGYKILSVWVFRYLVAELEKAGETGLGKYFAYDIHEGVKIIEHIAIYSKENMN